MSETTNARPIVGANDTIALHEITVDDGSRRYAQLVQTSMALATDHRAAAQKVLDLQSAIRAQVHPTLWKLIAEFSEAAAASDDVFS